MGLAPVGDELRLGLWVGLVVRLGLEFVEAAAMAVATVAAMAVLPGELGDFGVAGASREGEGCLLGESAAMRATY